MRRHKTPDHKHTQNPRSHNLHSHSLFVSETGSFSHRKCESVKSGDSPGRPARNYGRFLSEPTYRATICWLPFGEKPQASSLAGDHTEPSVNVTCSKAMWLRTTGCVLAGSGRWRRC